MNNLVLTRRLLDAVKLTVEGQEILITVVQIKGSQIRLAILADKEKVKIDRVNRPESELSWDEEPWPHERDDFNR